jgi:hypothetical protein
MKVKIVQGIAATGVILTVTIAVVMAMLNPQPIVFSWSDAFSRLFWFAITWLAGMGITLIIVSIIHIRRFNAQQTKEVH